MKKILRGISLCLVLVFLTACGGQKIDNKDPDNKVIEVVDPTKEISIIAVGDIMFHSDQIRSGLSGNEYDFKPMFEDLKSRVGAADIAIGNFETTVNPDRKPAGYPCFNVPEAALTALKYVGFDVLTTVNNHSMDTGKNGLLSTVSKIREHGMLPIGTGEKEDKKYEIVEKNGIKVGTLAYTYGTNGIPSPEGMVNLIDIDKIKSDMAEVRPNCDYLIVSVHMGTEYVRKIEDNQQRLFREIADAGADCILGGHPHVVRPSEIYNTNGRDVFITYSMGNLVSGQVYKYTDMGSMITLNITKKDGKTTTTGLDITPVYRHKYKEGGKSIIKAVLYENLDKYKNIGAEQMKYIQEVSKTIKQSDLVDVFNQK